MRYKTYRILYRTKDGQKRVKLIKALDIKEASDLGETFCAENGRVFYAID